MTFGRFTRRDIRVKAEYGRAIIAHYCTPQNISVTLQRVDADTRKTIGQGHDNSMKVLGGRTTTTLGFGRGLIFIQQSHFTAQ
jgi:hypothetical protein